MSKESIKDIDARLKEAEGDAREQLMAEYASDDRAGVQKLLEKYDAEALFIDHKGKITMTEGMQQYFHLSNSQK